MGGTHTDIAFPEETQNGDKSAEDPINDEAKIRARAEKYGVPLSDKALARPKPGMVRDDLRKAKALQRSDGIPSFNLYSEEEIAKQNDRAARFGTAPAAAPVIAVATPSEEDAAKKARAAKYGLEYQEPDPAGLDKDLLMEERREADRDVASARPEALHVYGVDLIGSADLLRFFQLYGPTFVEWIDDSSCNVLFADEFAVKRVLVQLGEALPAQQAAEIDATKPADDSVAHLWYRAKNALMREGVAVPLLFRIAMTSDCKDYLKRRKTRRLWTMPMRKAISVAQGNEEPPPAPKRHGGGKEGLQKGQRKGANGRQATLAPAERAPRAKRERIDDDGDAVMIGVRKERGGKSRRRRADAMDVDAATAGAAAFLRDDDRREDGAQSYFLNLDDAAEAPLFEGAPVFDGAAAAHAQPDDDKARALLPAAAAAAEADVKAEYVDVKAEPGTELMQVD